MITLERDAGRAGTLSRRPHAIRDAPLERSAAQVSEIVGHFASLTGGQGVV